jgi:predicted nucleic acid binding AN1-type Zn finger protein
MNKIDKFKKFLKDNVYNNEITEEDGKIKVVGGYLDLSGTNITELPDNLTVGGSLDLRGTNITELPDNLTVGGSLDLRGTNITELPDNLTVGGYLYLSGTNITELPDNLTVGGYLDLSGTNITELPDNLTVGGSLDLRGTNITELPDNLMVEGSIYGFNTDNIISVKKVLKGYNKELNYIYFDGILWGNVKSVKKVDNITIYKTPLGYCVVEDSLSAHGKTLRQAMEDLTFKKMKNKDVSDIVAEIKKTGKVTRMQYRAITGACQFGTEQFCKQHNIEDLEEIELEELRKILINDYGARKFWELIDG